MPGPQEDNFRKQIDAISSGAWRHLHRIGTFDEPTALRIVSTILEFACQAVHMGSIAAGRNAFGRLPREWLDVHLGDAVEASLDLNDEWEYRRLLELLAERYPLALSRYVEHGKASPNSEVVEAAIEFSS